MHGGPWPIVGEVDVDVVVMVVVVTVVVTVRVVVVVVVVDVETEVDVVVELLCVVDEVVQVSHMTGQACLTSSTSLQRN